MRAQLRQLQLLLLRKTRKEVLRNQPGPRQLAKLRKPKRLKSMNF